MIPVAAAEFLNREGCQPVITPLDPEASARRYYRLDYPDCTLALCQDVSLNSNFVEISAYYSSRELPVPVVLKTDRDNHLLLQTWCGKTDLSTVVSDRDYFEYAREAIDMIVALQKLQPPAVIAGRSFDYKKLLFELDFARRHLALLAEKSGDSFLMPEDIYRYMDDLAATLSQNREFVICHRDYHSRNLLLQEDGSLCMIDFQDSMMGVRGYDLASLLYDSYRPITAEMRKVLLEYFLQQSGYDRESFIEEYYLIAMQRAFKAFGSYLMLTGEKNMAKFRPSLRNCIEHLLLISKEDCFPRRLHEYFSGLKISFNGEPYEKKQN